MKNILVVFLLFFMMLRAEGVELNLPERFDVEASKEAGELNGRNEQGIGNPKTIFHFSGEEFICTIEKYKQYDTGWYFSGSCSGTFKDGILEGKCVEKQIRYCDNYKKLICLKSVSSQKLSGKVNSEGLLDVVREFDFEHYFDYHHIRNFKHGKPTNTWTDATVRTNKYNAKINANNNFQYHYLLQLPINQSQSSQTFLPDSPKEQIKPNPIQKQPILVSKTNLSANIGASPKTTETATIQAYDQCKDPNQDAATKEYCANKAYNAALDALEAKEERAKEERWKKEEAKHQAELAKQKEEDAYWQKKNEAYFQKQRREALKRSQEAEAKQNRAFHESIAKDQAESRAKQAEIRKAHEIVDRFGGDYASQRLSHKKIETLSKNADLDKSKKIKNAMRKQYFDSRQTKLQGEAAYQTAKAKEIGKKGNYVKGIKDTSLTANKIIARFDPTGTGEKIVGWQEDAYTAIEGHEKGGWGGAVDSIVNKKASDASNGWSDTVKEEIETYKKYQKEGITLKKNELYYDKDGNRFTKVKKGQKLYDKDHNEITFSFQKRIFNNAVKKLNDEYNAINTTATKVEALKEGVVTGDFNKAVNAGLDAMDAKESMDGVVKRVESANR